MLLDSTSTALSYTMLSMFVFLVCTSLIWNVQMPTVSRADCTQIDVVEEITKFHYLEGKLEIEYSPEIEFNECTGLEEDNNLESHYDLMVQTLNTATAAEKSVLSKTLVGEDGCEAAIKGFLAS